jgi:hypothetical protein
MDACGKSIGSLIALTTLCVLGCAVGAQAQGSFDYYYVANTHPPDAYLAMRSAPSSVSGERIEVMPNGTPLEILEKRPDGWWLVRNVRTARQGWALSGSPTTQWIVCCTSAENAASGSQAAFARGFKMPSNNIFCQHPDQDPASALRCDIFQVMAPPPRPADCDLDWGDAFEVSAADARGARICHGDTTRDDTLPVLNYGAVWNMHGLTCTSESTGLTCLNARGHGFRLSKALQQVF